MPKYGVTKLCAVKIGARGEEFGKNHGPGVGNLVKNFDRGVPNPHPCSGEGYVAQRIEGLLDLFYCVQVHTTGTQASLGELMRLSLKCLPFNF